MTTCAAIVQSNLYALWQGGTPPSTTAVLQFDRTLLLDNSVGLSANVSMGDLNGDGNLDIVLARGQHTPLVNRVLLNDGRGRFPVAQDLGTADPSFSAVPVDLDVDGDLDIVVSNDRPDPKPVYLNDGKGNFRLGSTYGLPEWSMRNASVADLNGDGLPDIIVANRADRGDGTNYVCLNRGKGKFDADCLAVSHESTTTIAPADINRDAFIDLIVPHRSGGQSHVYLNDGKASFSRPIPFGPPDAGIRVAEGADLDGDGFIDIVTTDEAKGPAIYFNQQGRAFTEGFSFGRTGAAPFALAVADLNADGKMDIVVGYASAQPVAYFNDGSGRNFTPVRFGPPDGNGIPYGLAIGDLDNDGHRDIAVARTGVPNVVYFGGPALRPGDRPVAPAPRPPGPGLISSFDGESITSLFGLGWFPASDMRRGGRSVSTVKLMPGGALGSSGSLYVQGEVAPGTNPYAGVTFWPAPQTMATANLSGVTRLSFWAKGDEKTYVVGLASGSPHVEASATFVAGREWREYTFNLSDFAGIEKQRVLWVIFSAGPAPGPFEFQIDEVRLQ
jgi:hypothetical protein